MTAPRQETNGKLKGKIALITGGSSGIGLAAARLFAREGATVVATGSSEKSVSAAREALNGESESVEFRRSNAADPKDVAELVSAVAETHGRIDVLFLNAGAGASVPLTEMDEETFDRMISLNLKGPWLALRAAAPHMPAGSSLIVNTSVTNKKGMPGFGAYAAAKAGLRSLVRSAAGELAPKGIRVNAVSPGPIETPIFAKVGFNQEEISGFKEQVSSMVPLGRMGTPEEIAAPALFLASDDSAYVHGAEIVADGGMTAV